MPVVPDDLRPLEELFFGTEDELRSCADWLNFIASQLELLIQDFTYLCDEVVHAPDLAEVARRDVKARAGFISEKLCDYGCLNVCFSADVMDRLEPAILAMIGATLNLQTLEGEAFESAQDEFIAAIGRYRGEIKNAIQGIAAIIAKRRRSSATPRRDSTNAQEAATPLETLAALPDEAKMNHAELADKLGLPAESLRKKLERWRAKNGAGWQEVTEPKPKESRYLYEVRAIRSLLNDAIASG